MLGEEWRSVHGWWRWHWRGGGGCAAVVAHAGHGVAFGDGSGDGGRASMAMKAGEGIGGMCGCGKFHADAEDAGCGDWRARLVVVIGDAEGAWVVRRSADRPLGGRCAKPGSALLLLLLLKLTLLGELLALARRGDLRAVMRRVALVCFRWSSASA